MYRMFNEKILQWKISSYEKYIIIKQKWRYYDFAHAINCTHKVTCVCAHAITCDRTCLREQYANTCQPVASKLSYKYDIL